MTIPERSQIRGEVAGAYEALTAAELLLRNSLPRDAVSSAYYATFHAARAALWSRGRNAKTHRGLAALFSRELIVTKVIEPEYLAIFTQGREQREKADYDRLHFAIAAEQASDIVADARRFVARIDVLLK